MPKIIKRGLVSSVDQVVEIPDTPPRTLAYAQAPGSTESPEQVQVQGLAMYDQMVQQAKREAEGIQSRLMELAHEEREQILSAAQQEAQTIRQTAENEGYQAGLQQGKEQVNQMLQSFNRALAELKVQHQEFMDFYVDEIGRFSLEIASRILDHQISMDQVLMAELVKNACGSVKNAEWLAVKLSDRMPALLERLGRDFPPGKLVDGKRIDLVPGDVPPGSCIVETPIGSIDASIQTQISKLEEYFVKAQ